MRRLKNCVIVHKTEGFSGGIFHLKTSLSLGVFVFDCLLSGFILVSDQAACQVFFFSTICSFLPSKLAS